MRRRGGLGRGLDALIPSSPQEDREPATQPADQEPVRAEDVEDSSGPTFEQLLIDRIDPNPRQPREAFDEEPLQELTASIEAVGVLQPIVVRPNGERYQIVMGERRVRAAKTAGLERIPAIVRTTEDDQLLRDALLENIHREDLNPLEEAAAYEQLLVDFGITQEELAAQSGAESARDRQRDAASAAARERSTPDRGQDAVGRSRPCCCFIGRSRSAGTTGRPDCGRGADRADGRGARPANQEWGTAART